MKLKLFFLSIIFLLALSLYFRARTPLGHEYIKILETYNVSDLNSPLKENTPTVDIVIFHSDNVEISWEDFKEEFTKAKEIYSKYGIQLNLVKALKIDFPSQWNSISVEKYTNPPKDGLDFYDQLDHQKISLPKKAIQILSSFTKGEENPERTIYFVTISDISISWFEKDENNKWKTVHSSTSALSFASYIYANRMPKKIRGFITQQSSNTHRKTMAHELGHKLINVSHEGQEVCPKGDGSEVPGLMGYGSSTEIFANREGRWHRERLLLSPYIYRLQNGKKVWNNDYKADGTYNDPIYRKWILKPACP